MNKPLKVLSALALTISLTATVVNPVSANSPKVMWGKTELKLGQIGKVTILEDATLVKINSDGSLSTVRMLKKGDEYRVDQYKGQHGGLYGVGGSGFVQKNTAKVKYETPSKSKLEQVNSPSKPVNPPVTVSQVEKVFKETLGSEYVIKSDSGIVAASISGKNIFIYNKEEKNYMLIKDVKKSSVVYELMKSLGFSISETEFNNMISLSKKNKDTIQKGNVEVYATNSDIDVSW